MDPEPAEATTERPRAITALGGMPATLAIAVLCLAAWSAAALTGDTTSARHLVAAGALERGRVWAGEPWRLLSATFLHAGAAHLLWNVAGIVVTCGPVERALGSGRFLGIYLASALGGSAFSLLAQDVVSAGASGALFGILGAVLVLRWRVLGGWRAFLADTPTRGLLSALAAWNLIGLALVLAGVRMDHWAHVGGFASGAIAARVVTSQHPARPALPALALLAALCAAAAWPRPAFSRITGWELEEALSEALDRDDWHAARALVARGVRGGLDTPFFRAAREKVEGQRRSREP